MIKAKKTERITVRFTPDERTWLAETSNENGVSVSRYIRQVSLGELPQINKKLNGCSISQKEFLDLYKEVNMVGTNLNQIAKKLNIESARRKLNGEGEVTIIDFPEKRIKNFVKMYDLTHSTLSEIRTLIREVV